MTPNPSMTRRARRRGFAAALFFVSLGLTAPARAAADWNDAQIRWLDHDAGLAEAKRTGKPVCLVFFTTWCPHCHNYSLVFADPKVVEVAKGFVMVRLDKDKNQALSKRYAVDGEYIPRTYFLAPSGEIWKDITAPRPSYKYFFDESSPAGVLAGMQAALAKKR